MQTDQAAIYMLIRSFFDYRFWSIIGLPNKTYMYLPPVSL